MENLRKINREILEPDNSVSEMMTCPFCNCIVDCSDDPGGFHQRCFDSAVA